MNTIGAIPLHLPRSYNHRDVILLLYKNGAYPIGVSSNDYVPLTTAYKWPTVKDREGMASLLKQYGAK